MKKIVLGALIVIIILVGVLLPIIGTSQVSPPPRQKPASGPPPVASTLPPLGETKLGKVKITEDNQEWRRNQRAGITTFSKLEMRDKNGQPLNPNAIITLPSKKKITVQQAYDELNQWEQQLNRLGLSLRNSPTIKFIAPTIETELNRQKSISPSSGQFLGERALSEKVAIERKADNYVIQPIDRYAPQEYGKLRKKNFRIQPGLTLALDEAPVRQAPNPYGTLLHNFEYAKSEAWNFGSPGSFQASLQASAAIKGRFYQPAGDQDNMTVEQMKTAIRQTNGSYTFSGDAQASGNVLGKYFPIIDAQAQAYMPVKQDQKASIVLSAKMAGISVLNLSKEYSGQFEEKGTKHNRHKWSTEFNTAMLVVPISGEIGVRGEIGFEYELRGDKIWHMSGTSKPFVELTGYAQASADAYLAEAGVESNLTFIKGAVDIRGSAGIIPFRNVLSFYSIHANYDLELLSGNLTVYADILPEDTCDDIPILGSVIDALGGCGHRIDWEVFNWEGYRRKGALLSAYDYKTFDW